MKKIMKTDDEWQQILSAEEYRVLRKSETDRPFVNKYYHNKVSGEYLCAGCGSLLFRSQDKYESGSGWPSFHSVAVKENLETSEDISHGMHRTEVRCAVCGGHLGHLFPDGPEPTGLRYCINSTSLKFKPE